MFQEEFNELLNLVENSLEIDDDHNVKVVNTDKIRKNVFKLVEISATGSGSKRALARYLVRAAGLEIGVYPASIHELYIARGRGDVPSNFTVPAINLRILSFDAARAVFRNAIKMDASAILFEIARSEIGYTDQHPSEYATNMLGAAIAEGYTGPVFIQGDHFQVSPSRYKDDPEKEIQTLKKLIRNALQAGFFNIDVDTSTLVDLDKETVPEQQEINYTLSAELTKFIRSLEPEGVTVSIGGEIGEVGGQNSNEEELRAYVSGFNQTMEEMSPGSAGLSKISIQTGTSHGGVVLPDGSIAQVNVDFDTLLRLSQVSREEYAMAGAVQHGASTLPQDAFGKFRESEACEVHLATNFQNIFYDLVPEGLKKDIYAYLDENHSDERKPDMTDDQFYYKTRKRAIGAYKKQTWAMSEDDKHVVFNAWEAQFNQLFTSLGISGTKEYVEKHVGFVKVIPTLDYYLDVIADTREAEDTSDLAD